MVINAGNPHRHYSRNRILAVMLIALSMALVQVSSVNVALSSMQNSLGATPGQLQWVLSGYALAIGVFLVPSGRMGDLFGRSEVFAVGLVGFTLFSLLCSFATDATALNLLRLAQGASSGILSPQITGIVQQYFRGQARARAYALFGFVVSVSVAFGPVVTGVLISTFGPEIGWRLSFGLNVPLGLIGIIATWRWLPFGDRPSATERGRIDVDPVGVLLLVIAVVGIMLPFVSHNNPWMWIALPLAVVIAAAWILWERAYRDRGHAPMVDLRLFELHSFSWCLGISALQFLSITSVFATVAIYVQNGLGSSAMAAALIGLPNAVASAVASLWAGRYSISHGRGLQVAAVAAMALGIGSAAVVVLFVPAGLSLWWLSISFLVQGIGQGAMGSVNQTQAMLDVPASRGGVAGGVTQTVQRITTAIGNAMLTGVLFGVVGQRTGAAAWSQALGVTYGVITAVMCACLVAAIGYWRRGAATVSTD
ncbi:MFS transporter [Corynebacterium uterequi]|uniref:Major Facilitator Superfamily transporter n=1 Tax=Corynebacterium uterequi TaxID=1072256 RepID=A0A0G3HFK1_9CORY|nr:MFS transporter [Corynebacterium uterequi]AKK11530.1 Major Facilitator Superfamily transporter [Corynebacterium uterequi]